MNFDPKEIMARVDALEQIAARIAPLLPVLEATYAGQVAGIGATQELGRVDPELHAQTIDAERVGAFVAPPNAATQTTEPPRIEPDFHAEEPQRKARVIAYGAGGFLHWCPGCETGHVFDSRWSFNGNMADPTFEPSMKINTGDTVCHYYLRTGTLQFLPDSTHKLKGQIVPLPDLPDGIGGEV